MANLVAATSGNFNTSGTFEVADTTSFNVSTAANTALTTSLVASTTFTPGAITIDGYAVYVASVNASPSGTMTVDLFNSTDTVVVATTTINVSDIVAGNPTGTFGCSWYMFPITPTTLIAGKAYAIRASTSVAAQVNLYSLATTNWSRILRTTTAQIPAAADLMWIQGHWSGAGSFTTITVTNDNTATTAFQQIYVGNKGILKYGTTAATNYYLKSRDIYAMAGGVINIGTTGTPMPSTSTAVMEFDNTNAVNRQHGLFILKNGTVTMQGASKVGKTLLTADKAAAATAIAVTDTTGWLNGDLVGFGTTTTTRGQCETKTVNTVTNSTNFTLTAGLTNAHSGTSPTQGEVINLTRNVKFRGNGQFSASTGPSYIIAYDGAIFDCDYTEFSFMGSTNPSQNGFRIENVGNGSISIRNSAVHDQGTQTTTRFFSVVIGTSNGVEISDNVMFGISDCAIGCVATTGVNTFNNNTVILSGSTLAAFIIGDHGSTWTNNIAVGSIAQGFDFQEGGAALGTIDGNIAHGNATIGFNVLSPNGGTLGNCTAWRNGTYGIFLAGTTAPTGANGWWSIFNVGSLFGNLTANIGLSGQYLVGPTAFLNYTLNGGVTSVAPVGIAMLNNARIDSVYFKDCSIGATTAHSTSDFSYVGTNYDTNLQFFQTVFGSATQMTAAQQGLMLTGGRLWRGIGSTIHNNNTSSFREWQGAGTLSDDTAIFHAASPSVRMTPINPLAGAIKLISPTKIIPVASGSTITVSVWVRKSASGDGTAYTGAQPRLMVRYNSACGYLTDTALATASAANGTWELLSATSTAAAGNTALEFYVDCGSTGDNPTTVTGWVNIDDMTTTSILDPSDMQYPYLGKPVLTPGSGGSSGGSYGSS